MRFFRVMHFAAPIVALGAAISVAQAFDESKYPDFSGQWRRPEGVANQFNIDKPRGPAEAPPLTPEYQKIFEEGIADQEAGGQGTTRPIPAFPTACRAP
jgi:hypothetical protein